MYRANNHLSPILRTLELQISFNQSASTKKSSKRQLIFIDKYVCSRPLFRQFNEIFDIEFLNEEVKCFDHDIAP